MGWRAPADPAVRPARHRWRDRGSRPAPGSPEIADLAAEHDDGLFVFAGQADHVTRYRDQARNPRLGVLANEDNLDAALNLRPDRLLIHAKSADHLRQITNATTRTTTPIATADPSTHNP
jgi:hypothetical protein